ncbi:MAG: MATE family efflux transporter [Bacteroidota bacterium]
MHIGTSYRDIWKVSLPIIVGSAAQNVVALTDSVFLYYLSETDFAAITMVASFYIVIAAIGFSFSRGAQILISLKAAQNQDRTVGRIFYSMVYFELVMAVFMFLFMTYGVWYLFSAFVDSDQIFYKCMEYLDTRKWGVFASYIGVSIVALYTGLARPVFILIDTIILAVVNIFLDHALIFGAYGFPAMGMAGAGMASTIAEYVALAIFLIYILLDKKNRQYLNIKLPRWDARLIRQMMRLSGPIVAMAVAGLGSAFIFFGLVDKLGERTLAVTNVVRIAYLIFAIPCWGFSSGTNTVVSYFIGRRKRQAIVPMLWKTANLCVAVTVALMLPLMLFPKKVLYPIFGDERAYLIQEAYPSLLVLFGILIVFSYGSIFFNGMIGAGATKRALYVQVVCAVGYTSMVAIIINSPIASLPLAWSMEIVYWGVIFAISYRFITGKHWWKWKSS